MWVVGQSVSRPSAEPSTSHKSGFFYIGNEICFHEKGGGEFLEYLSDYQILK